MSWDQHQYTGQGLLGMPEIIALLEIEPEPRSGSRQSSQAGGHLGADRGRTGKNAVEGLTGDVKLPGRLAHGESEAGQNLIPQHATWMEWGLRAGVAGCSHDPALGVADCSVMGDTLLKARG